MFDVYFSTMNSHESSLSSNSWSYGPMVPSWNGYPSCLQVAAFTRSGQVQLLGPALSAHSARTHFARQVQGTLGRGACWPRDPWSFLGNCGEKWVCLKIAYPMTQWLMIIIPSKWLWLGVYPIFRHTQMGARGNDFHHSWPGWRYGRSANISSSGKFGTEIGVEV